MYTDQMHTVGYRHKMIHLKHAYQLGMTKSFQCSIPQYRSWKLPAGIGMRMAEAGIDCSTYRYSHCQQKKLKLDTPDYVSIFFQHYPLPYSQTAPGLNLHVLASQQAVSLPAVSHCSPVSTIPFPHIFVVSTFLAPGSISNDGYYRPSSLHEWANYHLP